MVFNLNTSRIICLDPAAACYGLVHRASISISAECPGGAGGLDCVIIDPDYIDSGTSMPTKILKGIEGGGEQRNDTLVLMVSFNCAADIAQQLQRPGSPIMKWFAPGQQIFSLRKPFSRAELEALILHLQTCGTCSDCQQRSLLPQLSASFPYMIRDFIHNAASTWVRGNQLAAERFLAKPNTTTANWFVQRFDDPYCWRKLETELATVKRVSKSANASTVITGVLDDIASQVALLRKIDASLGSCDRASNLSKERAVSCRNATSRIQEIADLFRKSYRSP